MDHSSLIASIIVAVFLLVFIIIGGCKGFLRILFTTFLLLIVLAAATALTMPFGKLLQEKTSCGKAIEDRVSSYVDTRFEKETVDSDEKQNSFIDTLALPAIIKNNIKENNPVKEYVEKKTAEFKEYVTGRISYVICCAIAFIALVIVLNIVFRIIIKLLHIISKIPIIHGINSLLGCAIGLIEGLLILWVIGILIMIFASSDLGIKCNEIINGSSFLSYIYNHNLLIYAFNSLIKVC